ncbi:hypothetical protein N7448_008978 [Penicillium atrosanguineum]|nr:hypothetical protein N7448_008978 [Penicillium atrosanguineum]
MFTRALQISTIALGIIHTVNASPTLRVGLTLDSPSIGISTTPEGRRFIVYARFLDGSTGPQVVEWKHNSTTPYPDVEWNSYRPGKDPTTHFVRVNAQRIGPDGALWVVDTGSPDYGIPVLLPGGPKLVQVDLDTNKVARVYPMANVSQPNSFLDDVRFHSATGKAYLTDAGAPGLIVLDLESGVAQRMLEDGTSTRGYMPISAEGTLVHGPGGMLEYIYADQLEVSPDGRWLYYQPCSGGMSRIETSHLDKAFYNSSMRFNMGQYVQPYAHTASTGGTAIDADGNIYISDTDRLAIQWIAPNGTVSTLLQDPRLIWIDAMWIDTHGILWMPSAQLSRGIPFNNGVNGISKPVHIYTIDIGKEPPVIDHH